MKTNVEDYLKSKNIEYTLHEHPPVYTCEEAEKFCKDVLGFACKNLVLKGKKSKNFFLYVLPANKKADLKKFAEVIEEGKVSFAKPEVLMDLLGLEPGAVSPFGLLNDVNAEIRVYIDEEVYSADMVSFHPNRNTASLDIKKEMFHSFLESLDHKVHVVK